MEDKNKIRDAEGMQRENASGPSEAEIRYSAVFEQSSDGILIIDAEGKMLDFNRAAHTELGYTREEFAKLSIADIDPVESPGEIRAHIQRTIGKNKAEFEVTHRTKSGQIRNVLVITQTIVLSGHSVLHVIWRDITEQKAADKKVRYLASILEHVPDAVCSMDTEGKLVSWNEGAERMLGYKADEIIGRPFYCILPEEDAAREIEHCIGALHKEGFFTGHETVRTAKDGRRVPVEISGLALRDGQKITGYASIMRDLTERKRVGENMKLFADTLDIAPASITVHDADGNFLYANQKTLDIHGYTRDEFFALKLHQLDAPRSMQLIESRIKQIMETGEATFEAEHYRKDKTTFPLQVYVKTITWEGKPCFLSVASDITFRKKTEEALRQSEKRLNEAQRTAHIGDWEWDITTNKVYWSDELFRIYGYEPYEIQPDYGLVVEAMHPDSRAEFLAAIDAALRGTRPFEMDYRFFRRDGVDAVLHAIGKVFCDAEGKPVRMVGIVQDITERKRAEEKLQESEDRFRSIYSQTLDGILIADTETKRFIEANVAICSMLGYTRDEMLGLSVHEIHRSGDLPQIMSTFERQIRGEITLAEDIPVLRKNLSVFYADINASIISLGGRPCLLGVFRDITERKRTEEALSRSKERYRSLFEDSPVSLWEEDFSGLQEHISKLRLSGIKDFRSYFEDHPEEVYTCVGLVRIISVNKATLELYEAPDHATLMQDLSRVFTAESFESFREILVSLAEGKRTHECEAVNQTLTGRKIKVLLRWSLLHRTGDEDFRTLVSILDITDRKEAEERLRRSEEFVRSILDTVDEGFIVIDRDFRILTANKAYCSQVGEPCASVIGRHCYEISHKMLRPCHEEGEECAVLQVFATGEPHAALHKHPDAKGSILYVETKAFPIKDSTGAVTSVIETVNNITENTSSKRNS